MPRDLQEPERGRQAGAAGGGGHALRVANEDAKVNTLTTRGGEA